MDAYPNLHLPCLPVQSFNLGLMQRLSKSQSLLIVLGAFILLALTVAFAIITWADRRETRREAEANLREIARLVEEHASVVIRANTILLSRVADYVADRPFAEIQGAADHRHMLRQMLADVPSGDSIWLFDENGDLVSTTADIDRLQVNVADRAYFKVPKETGQHTFMSPMIWGRVYGGFFVAMSRRLIDETGQFRGIAEASVDAGYFAEFYREVDPTGSMVFAIIDPDEGLVMRWPLPPPGMERIRFDQSPLFTDHLPRAPAGSFEGPSYIDGIDRLISYRRFKRSDLVVLVGMTQDAVFADWRGRTVRNAAYALGAAMVAIVLAGAAYASMGREARALRQETAKATELTRALSDNDVLFQELHHRIKNNLQIISSFLTMQKLRIKDPHAESLLQESIDRIQSMGLIHQTLYLQQEAASVDVLAYLRSLAAYLAESYSADQRSIVIEMQGDDVRLDLEQAVPVALAVNEAVTNALKHAFPRGHGRILVTVTAEDGGTAVTVSDDGVGFPSDARANGIGIHLLRALAAQLGGTVAFDNTSPGQGTRVTLRCPGSGTMTRPLTDMAI